MNSKNVIEELLRNNKIVTPLPQTKEFFLKKAFESIAIARLVQKESPMWTINISYYSMFFAANALLASIQKQIKDTQGIHSKISHALQYYFVLQNNKIPKKIVENYEISLKEAKELLQLNISNLTYESHKRKTFTYEINSEATLVKSTTSYERAREFIRFVERII